MMLFNSQVTISPPLLAIHKTYPTAQSLDKIMFGFGQDSWKEKQKNVYLIELLIEKIWKL